MRSLVLFLASAGFGLSLALAVAEGWGRQEESRLRALSGSRFREGEAGWLPKRLQRFFDLREAPGSGILLASALAGLGLAFFLGLAPPYQVSGLGLGPLLCLMVLAERDKARLSLAEAQVPILLDLLSLAVKSGSSLDQGLQTSRDYLPEGLLADELGRALAEIRLGLGREQALRALGQRLPLENLKLALASVRQAESLGSPIGAVLAAQARASRRERFHSLEAQAQKLPVKLLFPLLLFIFPVTLALILGPLALRLMDLSL